MKIGEARGIYSTQLKSYNEQKFLLAQQKKELEEKIKKTENGAEIFADEAATLELKYNAVSEKQEEYQNYMNQLMEQWNMEFDKVAAEQQADGAEEYAINMAKIMIIARRLMHGDIVPAKDEKKLMEFDDKLYQIAKNMGMMAQQNKKKKYESLWDDEEKKGYENPSDAADSTDAFEEGPEVVDVADTIAAATGETAPSEQ